MKVTRSHRLGMAGGFLVLLTAALLALILVAGTTGAEYDQSVTDREDDVTNMDTDESTDQYPEIDIVSFVTTDNGDGTVEVVITYKDDVATSGKYAYYGNVSDGEEESEHYAAFLLLVEYNMNGISYQNGDEDSQEQNVLVVDKKTLTATIDLTKCGIPEADFEITVGSTSLYSGNDFEDPDYADSVGEMSEQKRYKTTVEIMNDGEGDGDNDIMVTVMYEDDSSRAETPVEGAIVNVSFGQMEGDLLRAGTTDDNGELLLVNFVPGEYLITIEDDQYADYRGLNYREIMIGDNPILKVWAEKNDMDGDDIYTDGEIYVYYGAFMEDLQGGVEIYMDDEYVGKTHEEADHQGLEIEGPIAEGLHLIKADFRGEVAYVSLNIETNMEDSFSEDMHLSLVQEDGDPDDDLENDIYVEFTDDDSGDPISGVDIYLDDELMGSTDNEGSVIKKNLTDGYHEVTATYDGDDYFNYLLIGFSETHELGDFDFDGDKNDMKFTAEVGGLIVPYSTFVIFENDSRNGMPGPLAYTSFNGVGYVQDLKEDDYHGGIVNMFVGVVQFEEFNFSVGKEEKFESFVRGNITGSTRGALEDIEIILWDTDERKEADSTVTDGDGAFELIAYEGNFILVVNAEAGYENEYQGNLSKLALAENETRYIDVELGMFEEMTTEEVVVTFTNWTEAIFEASFKIHDPSLQRFFMDSMGNGNGIVEEAEVKDWLENMEIGPEHGPARSSRSEEDENASMLFVDDIALEFKDIEWSMENALGDITVDKGTLKITLHTRLVPEEPIPEKNTHIISLGTQSEDVDYQFVIPEGFELMEHDAPAEVIITTEDTGFVVTNPRSGEEEVYTINFTVSEGEPDLLIHTNLPDDISSEEEITVTINVTSHSEPVEGANVNISVTGEYYDVAVNPGPLETDANGQMTFTLTANNITEEDGEIEIDITVTKDGYEDGEYEKKITVTAWVEYESEVTEPKEHDLGDGNTATVVAGITGDADLEIETGTQPDTEDDDALGVYLEVTLDGTGDLNWVNITIDYDDVPAGIDPAKLKMYYWDDGNEEWLIIENSGVDTVNKVVWANVTHLTLFAPRQEIGSGDPGAPTITHDPILTGYAGQPIDHIRAEITDDDGVTGAELYYRKSTDTEYTKYDMTIGINGYYGKIPREFVTLDGVDYYIKATDGTNEALDPGVDMYHYIEITEATGNELPVGSFVQPLGGETFSGEIEIEWTASDPDGDDLQFLLSISPDSGATWQGLYGSMGYYPTVETTYSIDTTNTSNGIDTPNGATYRFMLELFDDGDPALSSAVQTGDFTIENEATGNQAPVISIVYPAGGETVTGGVWVEWTATDPDGDLMMYTVKLSQDSGATWEDIGVNLHSLVQLKQALDTTKYANGDTYRIKLVVSDSGDPGMTSELEGADFTITNEGGEDPEEDDDTPGFELIGVVAALVVVALVSRRRR